jgi:hypothetical protein
MPKPRASRGAIRFDPEPKNKNTMKTELIDAMKTLLQCRDFCGNEREALSEWESENRRLTAEERAEVRNALNAEWRNWQLKAGVCK